jgi:hypothetical protein
VYNARGKELLLSVLILQDHGRNKRQHVATFETSIIQTVLNPGPSQAVVPVASSPGVLGVRRISYVNSSLISAINTRCNCKGELLCLSAMLLLNFCTPTLEESAVLDSQHVVAVRREERL